MSKYTTGELAKLCGVSVRTVQYYDTREILVPSELSEGGRRLYSGDDLRRMKIICFLREMDMSINSIGALLREEHPEHVISILMEEQEKSLRQEMEEQRDKLTRLTEFRRELKNVERFSVEAIGDIAYSMENKKKIRRVRAIILGTGLFMELVEAACLVLWIGWGVWQPFALFLPVLALYIAGMVQYYYKRVSYICPECHTVFKPKKSEFFFAPHTMTTRKLTCTCCKHHGFCVETYGGENHEN